MSLRRRSRPEPAEPTVRGCADLRPHDAHAYSTATQSFRCPGITPASDTLRSRAGQMVKKAPDARGEPFPPLERLTR